MENNWTTDEASSVFDTIAKEFIGVEESHNIDRDAIPQMLKDIQGVESAVVREAIFSENEEFDDIDEQHVKFLFLPFVIGKLHYNNNEDRLEALKLCRNFFISFLKLMDHYHLCPLLVQTMLPKIEKDAKYRSEREEKIKVYKASRVAEDEMTALHAKMMQGSKNYKEFTKALLSFKCYQAVSDLEILPQEMEMLEFKKKLGQDSEFRRQYEEEQKKPTPKPFFQKIDSREKDTKVTQIHTSDLKPHSCGHHHVLGTPCPTKMDILDTLWQPDHAQPKMTMDQHADLEIYMMEKKHKREQEHQKAEDAKMAKLNEEDKDELQTYKDRMWDDWKDENEKGAGNKKR